MNRRPLTRAPRPREAGLAIVITSLMLVPLVGFAAMAVDFGSWYMNANRIQKATDAAATAGVVWLPDFDKATEIAVQTARRNGYDDADADIEVTVSQTAANRLTVRIVDSGIPLLLAGVVSSGVDIGRSSSAEYRQSTPMGSPNNTLGNDPVLGSFPNYWLQAYGTNQYKENGDRFGTKKCIWSTVCTGSRNDEFDQGGYEYVVRVSTPQSQPLVIEMFDVPLVEQGLTCVGTPASYLFGDASTQAFYRNNVDGLADYPPERYENASTLGGAGWCVGDVVDDRNYTITVIVREPDDTPFDDSDNPVLCWVQYGTANPTTRADFVRKLTSEVGIQPLASGVGPGAGGVVPAPNSQLFRDTFRNWAPVCTDTSPRTGDYLVTVRTNSLVSKPFEINSASSVQSLNFYSMRGGFGTPASNSQFHAGVSTFAEGRLPVYVNRPGGDGIPSDFYLARVGPEYAGSRLALTIFDIGNGSNVDISFQPDPLDSTSNYTVFSDCEFTVEVGGAGTVASRTKRLVSSNCAATAAANNFRPGGLRAGQQSGALMTAAIEIPPDWSCDADDPAACWVTASMVFANVPHDATTWTAEISGDPVHLVE